MDPHPRNPAQLVTTLESTWLSMPVNAIRNLIESSSCTSGSSPLCERAGWKYTRIYNPQTTRGFLVTDYEILNHGQVTRTTPELAIPLLTTTPHLRQDISALDGFNVHRCPTRRVFSGTGPELVTRQATIRYLYHSATADTNMLEEVVLYVTYCENTIKGSSSDVALFILSIELKLFLTEVHVERIN
ncbi:uncharacterized protein TNCV_913601 [Trichonephila clavipes]|nr:uncharacterized protein TNCV_913601 [Trichonephila clavipes]